MQVCLNLCLSDLHGGSKTSTDLDSERPHSFTTNWYGLSITVFGSIQAPNRFGNLLFLDIPKLDYCFALTVESLNNFDFEDPLRM
jgi:hypothetical protein